MSVVIVGGNECMVRQYKELCREYKCKAKIYPKMAGSLKNIGMPDLLVLFTNTVSQNDTPGIGAGKGEAGEDSPLPYKLYECAPGHTGRPYGGKRGCVCLRKPLSITVRLRWQG